MISLLENLTSTEEPIRFGQLTGFPAVCLVEDDESGLRWLIAYEPPTERNWLHAYEYGVVGMVTPFPDGSMRIVHREVVAERRKTFQDMVTVDPRYYVEGFTELPDHLPEPQLISLGRDFVHIHAHSEFSPLDGLAKLQEMVDQAVLDSQFAMAVTDHGVCAGHPDFQKVCMEAGVKPLLGIEAYLVNNRALGTVKPDEWTDPYLKSSQDYWHFIMMAMTRKGLDNLWAASTEAWLTGLHYHPRMDWSTLERFSEGILATTACLRGPLSRMIINGDESGAREMVGKIQRIFPDRLYVELHTNQLPEQLIVNQGLVSLAHDLSLPTIVVADSHYACLDHGPLHKVWIAMQTNSDLTEDGDLFSGDEHYHVHSAEEVAHAIAYLGDDVVKESMANTVEIANRCDVTIQPRSATPVYHRVAPLNMDPSTFDGVATDREVAIAKCMEAWKVKIAGRENEQEYIERWEKEEALLTAKGFWGYMLIVEDYTSEARRRGILMGPGRGSAAGSLVCWLLGITGIDPIEADLMFERFLTWGRNSPPDIDTDFPSSKRDEMTDYIIGRWGEEHVVRVGTHLRLKLKGVFESLARTLKTTHPVDFADQKAISRIITAAEADTAGLGLKWDELFEVAGDELEPFRQKYPYMFSLAEFFWGRLKGYGKHPAGLVIDPDVRLIDHLPLALRGPDKHKQPTAEYSMDTLEMLGYLKFDILTITTLDTIQACIDLIAADPRYEGVRINPDLWRDEYLDPQVWEMVASGDTLGIFQIETADGTKLTKQFRPESIFDLAAILTLVRPGPRRSGLTATYLRRRAGEEPVVAAHPLLEPVLGRTYQAMIYQEDIMSTCAALGNYSLEEADEVRKILGKKKVEAAIKEGVKFVQMCQANGVSKEDAERIWAQIQEFARYSFNRAHSWGYAMLSYWCAWFKCHFPAHFLVARLSTLSDDDKSRIPEFVTLARRYGYTVRPPDINESDIGFTVSEDQLSILYGLKAVPDIGDAAAQAIIDHRLYKDIIDFLDRRGPKCNVGHMKRLASIGAFDSLLPEGVHRAQLEALLDVVASGRTEMCAHQSHPDVRTVEMCNFDWLSEPVEIGKSGKPLKGKPIPKTCSRACRQYTEVTRLNFPEGIPELTPVEIRKREQATLGIYLSSTPFDGIDQASLRAEEIIFGPEVETLPNGGSYVCGMITAVRTRDDKYKRKMAFVEIDSFGFKLSVPAFSSVYSKYEGTLAPEVIALFAINKNNRGLSMTEMHPIPS